MAEILNLITKKSTVIKNCTWWNKTKCHSDSTQLYF